VNVFGSLEEVYAGLEEADDRTLLEIAEAFEEERHKHGWDQPAVLATLIQVGPVYALAPFPPMPPGVPPALILDVLAEVKVPHPPETVGYVLSSEAWIANTAQDSPLADQATAAAREHKLADEPYSQEIRMVQVCDSKGRIFTVQRYRETDAINGWADLDRTDEGAIPDGLRKLVKNLA
jgi:hypothetical protein